MACQAAQPLARVDPRGEPAELGLGPVAFQAGLVLGDHRPAPVAEDQLRLPPAEGMLLPTRVASHTAPRFLQQPLMHAPLEDLSRLRVTAEAGQRGGELPHLGR